MYDDERSIKSINQALRNKESIRFMKEFDVFALWIAIKVFTTSELIKYFMFSVIVFVIDIVLLIFQYPI